ncbi:MAG: glutamate--tRNA ligase [Vigna little leaf phytoplasma]|nr:glutamate--tRNA ligase [Vigna little leaf phytoplasma]
MDNIRLRYAPSPTGFLHIGNARTALFNYLFACRYQGTFIIRIEDTDLIRNIPQSEEQQIKELKWLGLQWKEGPDCGGIFGPYRQSERLDIYQKYAQLLLNNSLAYKQYSTNDTSKFVIRFKVPLQKVFEFNDLIRGHLSFNSEDIEDWIIIKENGFPTYNFAAAIDDHLMHISHIFRGEEHITNTPKQIMIYQAFGWEIPYFAHMSLILNKNKKKLSKRDTNTIQFIKKYIDLGYLPEALFNFLSLLGFSPKTNQTILSAQEIINFFDVKRLNKSAAIFDPSKLSFINSQYLKKMSLSELIHKVKNCFQSYQIILTDEWLQKFVILFRNRISYIQEMIIMYQKFFPSVYQIDISTLNFLKKKNYVFPLVKNLYNLLFSLVCFTAKQLNLVIDQLKNQSNLEKIDFFIIVRIACTGKNHGPSLCDYLELLGKDNVLKNIKNLINYEKSLS